MQRWSARRVGLWALMLALVVLATANSRYVLSTEKLVETPLGVKDAGCGDLQPLWLMAQSVPTASLVPCVQLLPVGWSVAEVAVNNGRSVITLDHDRAGTAAMRVELTAACDLTGATKVSSERSEALRYVLVDRASRAYKFSGGCITQRFSAAAPSMLRMSDTASTEVGFITREALRQALERRSDGRLQLDP
jgi:hypothetical protein